ncbi:MAG: outer membrane protein assembly factor BamD [Pseudomonadales bacterium]
MRFRNLLLIVSFSLITAACSWLPEEKEEPDIPETELYQQSVDALQQGQFKVAVEKLELLEARYPFGQYSQQAQLELIFAYYKNNERDAAIVSADRFIRLNPVHENVDYAYYLKGLAAFEQSGTFIEKYLPIDINQRDPGGAVESFDAFATLTSRFPSSQYAADANKRMLFLKNRLATHEVQVAEYYMSRGAFVAAANRARYVIENYKGTPVTPRALELMYQAYSQLKLDDLAGDAKLVLTTNYPNYNVQQYQAFSESLLSTATFGLFGSRSGEKPQWTTPETQQVEPKAEEAPAAEAKKSSWLNKLSFGLFD